MRKPSKYSPREEEAKHGIKPWEEDKPLPPNTAMSPVVQQKHLEEFTRSMGRPIYDFEFKILGEMMLNLDYANRRLAKAGQLRKVRSVDQLLEVFIERVRLAQARKLAGDFVGEFGGRLGHG